MRANFITNKENRLKFSRRFSYGGFAQVCKGLGLTLELSTQGGFLLRVNGTLQETKLLSRVVDSDAFFLRALRKFTIENHQPGAY